MAKPQVRGFLCQQRVDAVVGSFPDLPDCQDPFTGWIQRAKEVAELYHEPLYAVARKFPGESRHETALRYIRSAEEDANRQVPGRAAKEIRP